MSFVLYSLFSIFITRRNLAPLIVNVSVCANKLIENQVDIGLVPVAALLHIKDYEIISNYCIGAKGKVDSVLVKFEIHSLSIALHLS